MAINPRSIATDGISGDPLAVATLGYVNNNEGVTLIQTSGIASSEIFASSTVNLTVHDAGLNSTEQHGFNSVSCVIICGGNVSDEQFGTDNVDIALNSTGIQSEQSFGHANAQVTINSSGIDFNESFGVSIASYDQVVVQNIGIVSNEIFGPSSVTSTSLDSINVQPLMMRRRGGSSSASSSSSWNVVVKAEMMIRDGEVLHESEINSIKGATAKWINTNDKIVVNARKFEEIQKEEIQDCKVTVKAKLLNINTLKNSTMVVNATRILKVA